MNRFTLPQLPYPYNGLAPWMSETTLEFHHGKHLKTYLDNVNKLASENEQLANAPLHDLVMKGEGTLLNNAAQAWNHIFFFEQFSPNAQVPTPGMVQRIAHAFGSMDGFKKLFTESAISLFGSGWVWLSLTTEGAFQITTEQNAGNPMRKGLHPLMCVDVWEHAYYLDYQNRRADYLEAFWKLLDWNVVESRMNETVTNPMYY